MESIAAKIEGSENEVKWRLETRFKQKWQSKEKKKKKSYSNRPSVPVCHCKQPSGGVTSLLQVYCVTFISKVREPAVDPNVNFKSALSEAPVPSSK